jgi:23S rRNA (cytosine1962-C5)-methyltransferase
MGPKGTKWKLEDHLSLLLQEVVALLAPGGHLILNTYSGLSPLAVAVWLQRIAPEVAWQELAAGELCLQGEDGHLLPTGTLVRGRRAG